MEKNSQNYRLNYRAERKLDVFATTINKDLLKKIDKLLEERNMTQKDFILFGYNKLLEQQSPEIQEKYKLKDEEINKDED